MYFHDVICYKLSDFYFIFSATLMFSDKPESST